LIALLGLLTIGCAVIIASFSIDEEHDQSAGYALRAKRLGIVHDTVDAADTAKGALHVYEVTQRAADKETFLKACDNMASKVTFLRRAEHMSEEQSGQIIDLCVMIRDQLTRLGTTSTEDRMTEAGVLLDRVRRVVLGFALDELRQQDDKLEEQTKAAEFNRRMTIGMAIIEIFSVAGIVFLVMRLTRLESLLTVCAWSHRVNHEGQWMSLERYLEKRFGIRANDGLTREQAEELRGEHVMNGHELVRLIEFEKAAAVRAKEASRAIHSVRNHLTAVLCYTEMAGAGDPEAKRDMAGRVMAHANTISNEVDVLHHAVQSFNPGAPDFRVAPLVPVAEVAVEEECVA
jgi:hypothetical protein